MNMKIVTVAIYVGGYGNDIFQYKMKSSIPDNEIKDNAGHPDGKFYDFLIEKLVNNGCYDDTDIETADVTILSTDDIDEVVL